MLLAVARRSLSNAGRFSRNRTSDASRLTEVIASRSAVGFRPISTIEVKHTSKAIAQGVFQKVWSEDGGIKHHMHIPAFIGGGPIDPTKTDETDPETFLASALAACFTWALGAAARKEGKTLPKDVRVAAHFLAVCATADTHIGPSTSNPSVLRLAASLEVSIPGWALADIEKLSHEAHRLCPFSSLVEQGAELETKVVERVADF